MKRELTDILACPVCKSPLELSVEREGDQGEVESGTLRCPRCPADYPIVEGIPNLTPPRLRA